MTRERMSDTLAQLENKLNIVQIVRDHPWPSIAVAVGAGVALSGSRADVKAAAATVAATKGTSTRVGTLLDDVVASLVTGLNQAFQNRLESWVGELKDAIGAPRSSSGSRGYGDDAAANAREGSMTSGGQTWSSQQNVGQQPRAD